MTPPKGFNAEIYQEVFFVAQAASATYSGPTLAAIVDGYTRMRSAQIMADPAACPKVQQVERDAY